MFSNSLGPCLGIPTSNGTIPLITIQKGPLERSALITHRPLINKFKKELVTGVFDLRDLLGAYNAFTQNGSSSSNSELVKFYGRYNFYVIAQSQSPYKALRILKSEHQMSGRAIGDEDNVKPRNVSTIEDTGIVEGENETPRIFNRRQTMKFQTKAEADEMRRKILEGIIE